MRRLQLLVLVLALGGCKVLGDAFSAHPSAAARAAGQTLTVDRLAEIASQVKGMPLQPTNLSRLAGAYVDPLLYLGPAGVQDLIRLAPLVDPQVAAAAA